MRTARWGIPDAIIHDSDRGVMLRICRQWPGVQRMLDAVWLETPRSQCSTVRVFQQWGGAGGLLEDGRSRDILHHTHGVRPTDRHLNAGSGQVLHSCLPMCAYMTSPVCLPPAPIPSACRCKRTKRMSTNHRGVRVRYPTLRLPCTPMVSPHPPPTGC
jgi:hypothetical protein